MGQFWVILGLTLMGHGIIRVSKCDPVVMLVEIIINEMRSYNMCTANVRIIPIAIYIFLKWPQIQSQSM